ncbi:DUF724 domain-containing protein 2 isoform X2 [Ziziphus jujuba]|uniref:DUF724 domain-containing protein 2 isoform X2 n=1 Tax=Ziziphus jujuba TaxID=326968 RepID=A0A6P4B0F1_ZIZJJ|nr:DUF724 domain-containing protein 2 isoform X2 [Ziziphus jujuba]
MVGSESNELRQQQQYLSVGSEVEVSSDEDGFKGAWFRATIVESPISSSASKKRKKALVEYKNLVTDDGSKQLREHIDSSYVRPLPPDVNDCGFQEGDVVDADYKDGWWTGIIRKVLEKSKYRVFFDNPPDVIEFELSHLRLHQDWVGGKWVRPQRLSMIGSTFSSGTDVEVNFDKEDLRDAWFPAIVIKENEDNSFLVKYQNKEAKQCKDTVDFLHIRPPPPRYADRNYQLLEKVDALCDFAWRAGVIIKVLAERIYVVTFKPGVRDKRLNHSEIRPFVEWKDGKWKSGSKEVFATSTLQEELENGPRNTSGVGFQLQSVSATGSVKDNLEKQTSRSTNPRKNQKLLTHCNRKSVSLALTPSMKKVDLPAPNGSTRHLRPSKKLKDGKAEESPLSVTACQVRNGIPSAMATPTRVYEGSRRLRKPVIDDQPSKTESQFEEKKIRTKQSKDGLVETQRTDPVKSKGRRTKSQLKSPPISATGKEGNASGTAGKLVDEEGIQKEAAVPVILGLSAKGIETSLGKNNCQFPNEELLKLMRDPKKNLNDRPEDKDMVLSTQVASDSILADLLHSLVLFPNMEFKQQQAGGSSNKRKRVEHLYGAGNVAEEVVQDCTTDDVALTIQTAIETTDSQAGSRKKKAEVSGTKCMSNEGTTYVGAADSADDDDRPLSAWFGGMQYPSSVSELRLFPVRIVDQWSEIAAQANIGRQSPAIDAASERLANENQKLPFVKSSPVWKMIESMDVFRRMPQNPHFQPLCKCKEEQREGMAIGNMVTFSSLVDKIYKLQFDDPDSIFHSTLESLLDLEKHGFNVTVLQSRVKELLSIKDRQEKFQQESEDAESKIIEHCSQKTKLREEMEDIAEKISELEKKLASIKSEMGGKEDEIARLQLHVDAVNQGSFNARLDFEKLAAAPMKLG